MRAGHALAGNLTEAHHAPGIILPNNGQVLVIGGSSSFLGSSLESCELYDPATGVFSKTGSIRFARIHPHAQMLSNG